MGLLKKLFGRNVNDCVFNLFLLLKDDDFLFDIVFEFVFVLEVY